MQAIKIDDSGKAQKAHENFNTKKSHKAENTKNLIEEQIKGSNSIDELFDVIDKQGGIGDYDAEYLRLVIQGYIDGYYKSNVITRIGGLRKKVEELNNMIDKGSNTFSEGLKLLKEEALDTMNQMVAMKKGLKGKAKSDVQKTEEYKKLYKKYKHVDAQINAEEMGKKAV